MKIIRIIRLTLLAIVAVIMLWSTWNYFNIGVSESRLKFTPLTLPIEFVEGQIFQGQFQVELNVPYEIMVIFHRNIPQDDLDSLVGNLNFMVSSENRNVIIPISLSLWQNDTLILKSDTIKIQSYSHTNDYVGRAIGLFKGERGKQYRINITTRQTIPMLNKTSPVLRVSVIPSVFKTEIVNKEVARFVNREILFYSGILFIVMLLINIVFELRSRLLSNK
jgi:hypothetical protein